MPDDHASIDTLLAQAGSGGDTTGPVTAAIQPSTTFRRRPDGELIDGRSYARDEAPGPMELEALLARLDGGVGALAFGSGMAACAGVFAALRPGDHVVIPNGGYWGLRAWMRDVGEPWGLRATEVDVVDPAAVRAAIRPAETRLVWAELPSNPGLEVVDTARLAEVAHDTGARLVIDATVATPVLCRPIEHGADFVVHSATKSINGHSDVLAGAIVAAAEDEWWDRMRLARLRSGPVLGAFEAWLVLRGLRTLALRVRHQSATALFLAEALQSHPGVDRVRYPGLASSPGHAAAVRQFAGGFGGLLSIDVAGGEIAAHAVAGALRVFTRATSLGGTESLVEHRYPVEGPASTVSPSLLRLSVGLEDRGELLADLTTALDTVRP